MNALETLGLCLLIGVGVGFLTGDVFAGFGAAVFVWIALGIVGPRRRSRWRNTNSSDSASSADSNGGPVFSLWSRDDRIDNDGRWDNDSSDSGWGDSGDGGSDGGSDGGGGD